MWCQTAFISRFLGKIEVQNLSYGCCNLKNTSVLPKTVLMKGEKIKPLTKKDLRFYYEEISFEDFK